MSVLHRLAGAVAGAVLLGSLAAPATAAQPVGHGDQHRKVDSANDLLAKLLVKVNAGNRKAVRKLANKPSRKALFMAHAQGYTFDQPVSECVQNSAGPQDEWDCETAHRMDGQVTGSAYFTIKKKDGRFRAVVAFVAVGE